jgi:hypothetical protein
MCSSVTWTFFKGGLGIGKLLLLIEKFFLPNFFQFLVIKTLDPDWIRIQTGFQPKIIDPDPDKMNADPQPCLLDTLNFTGSVF